MSVIQKIQKGMLSVEEAAQELGLKESTIRAWILRRRITYVKLNRAVRIPRAEVERLIREGTIPSRQVRDDM
jgi:excisionase family DNA binding protein